MLAGRPRSAVAPRCRPPLDPEYRQAVDGHSRRRRSRISRLARLLARHRYLVLGTANDDGRPWAAPAFHASRSGVLAICCRGRSEGVAPWDVTTPLGKEPRNRSRHRFPPTLPSGVAPTDQNPRPGGISAQVRPTCRTHLHRDLEVVPAEATDTVPRRNHDPAASGGMVGGGLLAEIGGSSAMISNSSPRRRVVRRPPVAATRAVRLARPCPPGWSGWLG